MSRWLHIITDWYEEPVYILEPAITTRKLGEFVRIFTLVHKERDSRWVEEKRHPVFIIIAAA
jgi:hypothetical protein